jgi:hypothetical protein
MIARAEGDELAEPYRLVHDLLRELHPDLLECNFFMTWKLDKEAPPDPVKASPVKAGLRDRADADYEVVVSHTWWRDALTTYELKLAYLDEALEGLQAVKDEDGEFQRDTKGRLVLKRRDPDIQAHKAVVDRRGPYSRVLRSLQASLALQARVAAGAAGE